LVYNEPFVLEHYLNVVRFVWQFGIRLWLLSFVGSPLQVNRKRQGENRPTPPKPLGQILPYPIIKGLVGGAQTVEIPQTERVLLGYAIGGQLPVLHSHEQVPIVSEDKGKFVLLFLDREQRFAYDPVELCHT